MSPRVLPIEPKRQRSYAVDIAFDDRRPLIVEVLCQLREDRCIVESDRGRMRRLPSWRSRSAWAAILLRPASPQSLVGRLTEGR